MKPVATVLALLVVISIVLSPAVLVAIRVPLVTGSWVRVRVGLRLAGVARLVHVCGNYPGVAGRSIARQRQPKRSPADGQRDDRQND